MSARDRDPLRRGLATLVPRRRAIGAGGGLLASLVGIARVAGAVARVVAVPRAAGAVPSFYDPPNPLPPGKPGEVIRTEPMTGPTGTKAWRVLYHSTAFDGHDAAVSGMVALPDRPAPAGGFPVVSFAHGTVGTARTCAPSLDPFQDGWLGGESFFDQVIAPFLKAGYAVAATDYRGLGTPGVNPYLVGADAGHNVLDAARAVRALPDLTLGEVTLLWGQSQGGQAVAFAAELAASYAPELRLTGVVIGAPASELAMLASDAEHLTGRALLTGLMVMIVRAWSAAYPQLDPSSALTPAGVRAMGIVDRVCVTLVLLRFALRPAPVYIKRNATAAAPWPDLLAANTPRGGRIAAPVFVFLGEDDDLIPPRFTRAFVQRLCAAGNTVLLKAYPGVGHLDAFVPAMPDSLAWMADRLANRPAPTNCGAASPPAATPEGAA